MSEIPTSFSDLPEKSFSEDNHETVQKIFKQIDRDFPEYGADDLLRKNESGFSPQAMRWMWERFMGQQHGTSEGAHGKIPLSDEHTATYWPLISELHFGSHGFTEAEEIDPSTHYTHGLILGGFPQEIVSRLKAGVGDPREGNVDASTLLAGQRLRWSQAPGERSVAEIYESIARYTGADMDILREQSPWMRQEEQKIPEKDNAWTGPYATELEIARLGLEAYFRDVIDWKNYDVDVTEDLDARDLPYTFNGQAGVVPARRESVLTYELTNGTKAHILNAAAVPRAQGVPRPTSDSQAREMVELGLIGNRSETLNVGASPPHLRGGIDVFIRLLNLRVDIVRADVLTHHWLPDKELITALGEIPATYKASERLKAVLAGEDPDSEVLRSL